MVGVNGIIGGMHRQDLATGAPLSSAEGNAQAIVGVFSLATTFTGAGAAGAAGKAGSVAKGTAAASKGSAAATGGAARTVKVKVASSTDAAAKKGGSACPANPSGCFVTGTLVLTVDGAKAIEELREGDLVFARDEFTGGQGFKPVLETMKRQVAELVHLKLRKGSRAKGSAWRGASEGGAGSEDPEPDAALIVGTDEHPFWSMDRSEWVPMGKLRVGERLSLADGSFATVTSISFELSPRTTGRWKQGQACTGTFGTKADAETGLFVVYNLIVADWHTYFAAHQGLAAYVHNGGPCRVFNDPVQWRATDPLGTGQAYKVYQRNDIDWNHVRTGGDRKGVGLTNREAAKQFGLAPQLGDGSFATLHHIGQDAAGPLAEASTRYHGRFGTQGQRILHSQYGRNKPSPNPPDRARFAYDNAEYWRTRGLSCGN